MAKLTIAVLFLVLMPLVVWGVPGLVSAETITLKSGKTVQGAICKVDDNFYWVATLKRDGLIKIKKEAVAQISSGTESEVQPVCPEKAEPESRQAPQNIFMQQQQQQQQQQEQQHDLGSRIILEDSCVPRQQTSAIKTFFLELFLPPAGVFYAATDGCGNYVHHSLGEALLFSLLDLGSTAAFLGLAIQDWGDPDFRNLSLEFAAGVHGAYALGFGLGDALANRSDRSFRQSTQIVFPVATREGVFISWRIPLGPPPLVESHKRLIR